MKSPEIKFHPIGTIHSPFTSLEGIPIQPAGAAGIRGQVEVQPELSPGLDDLEGYSHLILIYFFHQAGPARLKVIPYLDQTERGVFSTRAPVRPNRIGISVVRLLERKGNLLEVENLDVLDGTPLLDIKPYVPDFNLAEGVCLGWLEEKKGDIPKQRSDERFG